MKAQVINQEGSLTTLKVNVDGQDYYVIVTKGMKLWGVPVGQKSADTGNPDIYDILHNDNSPFTMSHKPNQYNHSDYFLKPEYQP